ncbi:MAG: DUF3276 family protein [Treponema sp.]|jgi:hypothetical protein|nr:DUF3276 family protein [Treponema sp.]
MGLRGELFSTRVLLQNRTYFFNVKENRVGDIYLNIVESKNRDEGGFDRQSVILFAEDLQEFLKGFDEALHVLEKEVRERRREKRTVTHDAKTEGKNGREDRGAERGRYHNPDGRKPDYAERPRKGRRPSAGPSEGRPQRGSRKGRPSAGPQRGRRVIVKKK